MQKRESVKNMDVRHGQQPALYTSQFLISAGVEEVILDCVSGIENGSNESTVIPVHTKLALSWGSAERLASLLNQALSQRPAGTPVPAPNVATHAAKLPTFSQASR